MKKILLLVTVCGLGFTGCAMQMATSIKTVDAGPKSVRPLPLTADLIVSERKTRGEAHGRADADSAAEDLLIREAVARALDQNPPKADAADVLVAMNVYKERNGKHLTVVVTGYPAWYRNFRNVEQGDSAWLIFTNTGGSAVRRDAGEGLPIAAPGRMNIGAPPKAGGAKMRGVGARFGVHAESQLNFTSIESADRENFIVLAKFDPGLSGAFGFALKIPVAKDVSINAGANFKVGNICTSKYDTIVSNSIGGTYRIKGNSTIFELGMSAPLFAQYTLPDRPVYLGAGVQLGVNFLTKTEYKSERISSYGDHDKDGGSEKIDYRSPVDFGLGFGAGYMALPNLDIGVRWVFNVNEPFDKQGSGSNAPPFKIKSSLSILSIGATYMF